MTRSSLAMLALAAATLMTPRPGQAAPYWPWCSAYLDPGHATTSCAFSSWGQCMETVSGIGGYCYVNPYPPPALTPAANQRRPAAVERRG
jgi:hypothetical protein